MAQQIDTLHRFVDQQLSTPNAMIPSLSRGSSRTTTTVLHARNGTLPLSLYGLQTVSSTSSTASSTSSANQSSPTDTPQTAVRHHVVSRSPSGNTASPIDAAVAVIAARPVTPFPATHTAAPPAYLRSRSGYETISRGGGTQGEGAMFESPGVVYAYTRGRSFGSGGSGSSSSSSVSATAAAAAVLASTPGVSARSLG